MKHLVSQYKDLLEILCVNEPLQNKHIFYPLSMFPSLPVSIRNNSSLFLLKTEMGADHGGFFWFHIKKNKYIFYIAYNEKFDKFFNEVHYYPFIRKAVIVHEFCHFLAFANLINQAPLNYDKIIEESIEKIKSSIVLHQFIASILSQDDDVNESKYKEYFDSHFNYTSSDGIDYADLFEKLLLTDNDLQFHWDERIRNHPINEMITNNNFEDFTLWINQLFEDVSDNCKVYTNIVKRRVIEKLPILIKPYIT